MSLVGRWLEQLQRVCVGVAGESEGDVVEKTRLIAYILCCSTASVERRKRAAPLGRFEAVRHKRPYQYGGFKRLS